MTINYKNELIGIRASEEFVSKLDDLCDQLGQKRSTVIRYALREFIASNQNSPENLNTTYAALL